MSKREHIDALAKDFDVSPSELIDAIQAIGRPKSDVSVIELIDARIKQAEHVNLSDDYINGLKDARKLLA